MKLSDIENKPLNPENATRAEKILQELPNATGMSSELRQKMLDELIAVFENQEKMEMLKALETELTQYMLQLGEGAQKLMQAIEHQGGLNCEFIESVKKMADDTQKIFGADS